MGLEVAVGAMVIGAALGAVSGGIKAWQTAKENKETTEEAITQTEGEEELLQLEWEKAKAEAEDTADEMEALAEQMQKSAETAKEMGLEEIGLGYEELFGQQQQSEAEYGTAVQEVASAQSATVAGQGASGLRNTGSLAMVAEYQKDINTEQLDLARASIDLQRDVGVSGLQISKTELLSAYDDAIFEANQLFDEAQDLRDAFADDSYNAQIYEKNKELLESKTDFLEDQLESYTGINGILDVIGGIFGGATSGFQAGANLGQGFDAFGIY